jgi:hypothetical protein
MTIKAEYEGGRKLLLQHLMSYYFNVEATAEQPRPVGDVELLNDALDAYCIEASPAVTFFNTCSDDELARLLKEAERLLARAGVPTPGMPAA